MTNNYGREHSSSCLKNVLPWCIWYVVLFCYEEWVMSKKKTFCLQRNVGNYGQPLRYSNAKSTLKVPHTCTCMFTRRDLFPPGSIFIQIFVTRTCKFMQIYASSRNSYASLLLLFLLFPCPESSPLIQGVLPPLFLLLVQGNLDSKRFGVVQPKSGDAIC